MHPGARTYIFKRILKFAPHSTHLCFADGQDNIRVCAEKQNRCRLSQRDGDIFHPRKRKQFVDRFFAKITGLFEPAKRSS
jgi:hypothetical protein